MTHGPMIITHLMTATVKEKKEKQEPCLVISKTKWIANRMRNEALLPLINYIITHISLYFTP